MNIKNQISTSNSNTTKRFGLCSNPFRTDYDKYLNFNVINSYAEVRLNTVFEGLKAVGCANQRKSKIRLLRAPNITITTPPREFTIVRHG